VIPAGGASCTIITDKKARYTTSFGALDFAVCLSLLGFVLNPEGFFVRSA